MAKLMQLAEEIKQLNALIERHGDQHGDQLRVDIPLALEHEGLSLPLQVIELGSTAVDAPVLGFFGGVHGNENIGAQVVIAYLESLLEQLTWDEHSQALLKRLRLIFMPIVNPVGIQLGTRGNAAGVDLMRSAPVQAQGKVLPLLGGHRISPNLPWYRGPVADVWQPEAEALVNMVKSRMLAAPFAVSIDCHSGFGAKNRLWFPYAKTQKPIKHLAEVYALRNLFRRCYSSHVHYRIEPQASSYLTHGDLWDYLYDESLAGDGGPFLPLTLEMGSWLWVRKNPRQLFTRRGLFNPQQWHRKQRILRQHLVLFDFLARATAAWESWLPQKKKRRKKLKHAAKAYWHNSPNA